MFGAADIRSTTQQQQPPPPAEPSTITAYQRERGLFGPSSAEGVRASQMSAGLRAAPTPDGLWDTQIAPGLFTPQTSPQSSSSLNPKYTLAEAEQILKWRALDPHPLGEQVGVTLRYEDTSAAFTSATTTTTTTTPFELHPQYRCGAWREDSMKRKFWCADHDTGSVVATTGGILVDAYNTFQARLRVDAELRKVGLKTFDQHPYTLVDVTNAEAHAAHKKRAILFFMIPNASTVDAYAKSWSKPREATSNDSVMKN